MNTVESKKTSKIILGLNICAAIMMVFAIFNIYASNKYISDLVMQGFKPSEQIGDVIKFYLNAVTPYTFYAICLYVLGTIVKKIDFLLDRDNKVTEYKVCEENKISTEGEEDIVEILLKESQE